MEKETIVSSVASQATSVAKWGGAGIAGTGAFTLNEYLAIGGFTIAAIGTLANFLLTWYYKEKEYRLRLRDKKESCK